MATPTVAVNEGSATSSSAPPALASSATASYRRPIVCLVVGMAGTGKTTLVQRLNHFVVDPPPGFALRNGSTKAPRAYFINLDPAVAEVPFEASIDIRDTVDYKGVMSQYRLGPNGAIMTALNLFATKIHQVIDIVEKRRDEVDVVFVDTPGQIEVFTWSASGQLIAESFAASFPTCVLFVADAVRCSNPQTFMSTMLYSSSIMYKMQLPLVIVVNKIDVARPDNMMRWMVDPEALSDAVRHQKQFSATLTGSLSLFVHEFYEGIRAVPLSAVSGEGVGELFNALDDARRVYESEFVPLIEARAEAKRRREVARTDAAMARLRTDLKHGSAASAAAASTQ